MRKYFDGKAGAYKKGSSTATVKGEFFADYGLTEYFTYNDDGTILSTNDSNAVAKRIKLSTIDDVSGVQDESGLCIPSNVTINSYFHPLSDGEYYSFFDIDEYYAIKGAWCNPDIIEVISWLRGPEFGQDFSNVTVGISDSWGNVGGSAPVSTCCVRPSFQIG